VWRRTTKSGVDTRAAPLLHSLHWFAGYKTHKVQIVCSDVWRFHGTAPVNLTDLCSRCTDHRLRSSARGNFLVRRTRTRFTDSSFTVAGPAAWNSLPAHIRMNDLHSAFCRHLKPICSLFLTGLTVIVLYYYCTFSFHFYFIVTAFCKALLSTGWGTP